MRKREEEDATISRCKSRRGEGEDVKKRSKNGKDDENDEETKGRRKEREKRQRIHQESPNSLAVILIPDYK